MSEELTKVTSALIKRGNHRGFLTMAEVQQELEDIEAPGEAFEKVADELRLKGIRLQEEGRWEEASLFRDQERSRLRAAGMKRSESGEAAWKAASSVANDTSSLGAGRATWCTRMSGVTPTLLMGRPLGAKNLAVVKRNPAADRASGKMPWTDPFP